MQKQELQPVLPRKRKYAELYTSYQMWVELNKLKTRMTNRIGAVERGDSNMDTGITQIIVGGGENIVRNRLTAGGKVKEREVHVGSGVVGLQDFAKDEMHYYGSLHPMWTWVTSISGIAGNNAAKFLALIDDIERFPTVSALWRYSGYGLYHYWVNKDGRVMAPEIGYKSKRETKGGAELTVRWQERAEPEDDWELVKLADPQKSRRPSGWNAPDNTILKSHLFVMNEGMIRTQKGVYVDMYYPAKEKYLAQGKTKGHAHFSSFRIMSKALLKDFWLEFRRLEGLPITDPYA